MILMDRVRAWLARTAEELRALPIVQELWRRIEGDTTKALARDEALDYFLNGYSVAQAAALLWPGHHGPVIVQEQRQLEGKARSYILQLEADVLALKQSAAQAAGHAAVRAKNLDSRIAALEKENSLLRQRLAQAAAPAPTAR